MTNAENVKPKPVDKLDVYKPMLGIARYTYEVRFDALLDTMSSRAYLRDTLKDHVRSAIEKHLGGVPLTAETFVTYDEITPVRHNVNGHAFWVVRISGTFTK